MLITCVICHVQVVVDDGEGSNQSHYQSHYNILSLVQVIHIKASKKFSEKLTVWFVCIFGLI